MNIKDSIVFQDSVGSYWKFHHVLSHHVVVVAAIRSGHINIGYRRPISQSLFLLWREYSVPSLLNASTS